MSIAYVCTEEQRELEVARREVDVALLHEILAGSVSIIARGPNTVAFRYLTDAEREQAE